VFAYRIGLELSHACAVLRGPDNASCHLQKPSLSACLMLDGISNCYLKTMP